MGEVVQFPPQAEAAEEVTNSHHPLYANYPPASGYLKSGTANREMLSFRFEAWLKEQFPGIEF